MFKVQQVKGDGSCLFDSLSLTLSYLNTSKYHPSTDFSILSFSSHLRSLAIQILNQTNQQLIINQNESISSRELLNLTSKLFHLTPNEYCQLMLQPYSWGGGPEIIALSNYFNCSINIYEVITKKNDSKLYFNKSFTFGPSNQQNKGKELNILFTNGKFPYLTSEEVKEAIADHFLPMFEIETDDENEDEDEDEEEKSSSRSNIYNDKSIKNSKRKIDRSKLRWKTTLFGHRWKKRDKLATIDEKEEAVREEEEKEGKDYIV